MSNIKSLFSYKKYLPNNVFAIQITNKQIKMKLHSVIKQYILFFSRLSLMNINEFSSHQKIKDS